MLQQKSLLPENTWRSWFRYFKYDEENESPSDVRTVLLIIATLIVAVTFQAGVNPPGGVWQDTKDGRQAGRAIYGSHQHAFYVFLVSTTLALSTSILVIISLTYRLGLHLEIWVATISMIVTYGSAVFAVTPRELFKFRYIMFTSAVPFMVSCSIQTYKKLTSKPEKPEAEADQEKQAS